MGDAGLEAAIFGLGTSIREAIRSADQRTRVAAAAVGVELAAATSVAPNRSAASTRGT
jgi:hypothetical protein